LEKCAGTGKWGRAQRPVTEAKWQKIRVSSFAKDFLVWGKFGESGQGGFGQAAKVHDWNSP
jgi:hypothetical protein